jgi:cell wall-associated NlpC family hydrolase
MQYTIKAGDTLGKIAGKQSIPVSALMALNPQITNINQIAVGQVINVPNMQDVPANAPFDMPLAISDLIARARKVVNSPILYKLGSGGMFPGDALPSRDGLCDCSGFVCWVLHLSRQTTIPFYKKYGGWIFTDSMVDDVNSSSGIFERITVPQPGCIVVYGAGSKIGHVGIVSEVANGAMKKVIHCSSGNSRTFNAAIQETPPTVFNRPDALWGRFVG